MILLVTEWLASILIILGCLVMVKKHWSGWLFLIAGSVTWVILGIIIGMYGMVMCNLVIIIIDIYGLREWKIKKMKPPIVNTYKYKFTKYGHRIDLSCMS